MKMIEAVTKYAAGQGITESEALEKGLRKKFAEFIEEGAAVYAKA